MTAPLSWDVFCHVVDNYGDAAVCWRLARGLAAAGASRVRLWIDEPAVLRALVPALRPEAAQQVVAGIEVCRLAEEPWFGAPADVAVDAFGGGLPEVYAHALAARARSLWIVLEYLSAEPWTATHHALASPHPHLAVERYFFFPGFTASTGGLLREPTLDARRQAFLDDPLAVAAFWRDAGFELPAAGARVVSLFAYENPAVESLLQACVHAPEPTVVAVPAGRVSADVTRFAGVAGEAGGRFSRGALELRFLPFLPQDRYDELLWLANWNFVRGEDSFVRAQWAEAPFTWHIYPQDEAAHVAKLEAFLALYTAGLDPALAEAFRRLQRAWNGVLPAADVGPAWVTLWAAYDELRAHAPRWAGEIAAHGDLAMNLARFCAQRLE